jgi:hypothetical protein
MVQMSINFQDILWEELSISTLKIHTIINELTITLTFASQWQEESNSRPCSSRRSFDTVTTDNQPIFLKLLSEDTKVILTIQHMHYASKLGQSSQLISTCCLVV